MKKTIQLKNLNYTDQQHISQLRTHKQLSPFLQEALIGIMLGDGHLEKSSYGSNANSRLRITFAERYKPLAFYIYGLFCSHINLKGIKFSNVKSGKESKFYGRISLTSVASPLFNDYHKLFYKEQLYEGAFSDKIAIKKKYIKIIPLNIEELLSEVSLAFLLSGDGNYNKVKKVIRLCTNSYTKEEVELLSKAILNKFGIETRLEHTRNNQYILIVRTTEVPKLQNIVKKHMHPSMYYRIGLIPINHQI